MSFQVPTHLEPVGAILDILKIPKTDAKSKFTQTIFLFPFLAAISVKLTVAFKFHRDSAAAISDLLVIIQSSTKTKWAGRQFFIVYVAHIAHEHELSSLLFKDANFIQKHLQKLLV